MVNKFFKVLSIEFEDLEDSVDTLIASMNQRNQDHEITDYVLKENNSLLKRELADVLLIHKAIMKLSPEDYQSVEEANTAVLDLIYSFTGMPKLVHTFMEKRVQKVIRFINEVG